MSEYLAIQKQIAELQAKAKLLRETERKAAVEQIVAWLNEFDIAANEIGFSRKVSSHGKPRHPSAGTRLPAKYRDDKGNAWSGRGVQPRWLREAIASGRTMESLVV